MNNWIRKIVENYGFGDGKLTMKSDRLLVKREPAWVRAAVANRIEGKKKKKRKYEEEAHLKSSTTITNNL